MLGKQTAVMLQTYTNAIDTMGSQTFTWSDQRELDGALVPASGRDVVQWGKENTIALFILYLPKLTGGLTITTKDRFRVLEEDFGGTRILQVLYVANYQGRFLKLTLEEVEG